MKSKIKTMGKTIVEQSVQATETPKSTTSMTIGEKAEELAESYFQTYQSLLTIDSVKDRAENLALHDLVCEKLVHEFAIERLKEMIKNEKEEDAFAEKQVKYAKKMLEATP